MRDFQCLICKEKLRKHNAKKGVKILPKDYLLMMLDHETEEDVIKHIKEKHPKIYKKTMEEKSK